MSEKWTAEEVRRYLRFQEFEHDDPWEMLDAYADLLEARERGVDEETILRAEVKRLRALCCEMIGPDAEPLRLEDVT